MAEGWRRMVYALEDPELKHGSFIKTFANEKVLISALFQGIFHQDDIFICVPGNTLEKLCEACVSILSQTIRIIAYFETAADAEYHTRKCSKYIDKKVQCCLKRHLSSILDGVEISSILYKSGQLDTLTLINKLQEIRQRFSKKEQAAETASSSRLKMSKEDQECLRCKDLSKTQHPQRYFGATSIRQDSTASSSVGINAEPQADSPPEKFGESPQEDRLIDDVICRN